MLIKPIKDVSLIGKERFLNTKTSPEKQYRRILFVHFDQLNTQTNLFKDACAQKDLVLFIEPLSYLLQAKHHKKKILLMLSAMRLFAQSLKDQGWQTKYYAISLDKPLNDNFEQLALKDFFDCEKFEQIYTLQASSYEYQKFLESHLHSSQTVFLENDLFLSQSEEFSQWAMQRSELTMEYFYRMMRKKLGILMTGAVPQGGKWNYDKDNRQSPPDSLEFIQPYEPDYNGEQKKVIGQVQELINKYFSDYYGSLEGFRFPLDAKQAEKCLSFFIDNKLDTFGRYQDIMMQDNPWLYHAHISFPLNIGLLKAQVCLEKACDAYEKKLAPLSSVEGFIRQILGWREFLRGIYWHKMPGYEKNNFFNFTRELPDFFWHHQTKLNCLAQSLKQSHDLAYAHHIQRLMIIGNFSLLAELNPQKVDYWFSIAYADAYQWVHTPNVIGMALFADGGVFATKPYISSGAYIQKMSNYCDHCHFKVNEKSGERACPFNYLYWNFLEKNQEKLRRNHRMRMIYSTLDKMKPEKREQIRNDSENFLKDLALDS